MKTPFLKARDEEILKESTVEFFVGGSHSGHLGYIYLTNKRLVIVESSIAREQVYASVPIDSLLSAEPHEIGALFLKRTGFKLRYGEPAGGITEVRVYPPDRPPQGPKRDVALQWAREWGDTIEKVFQSQ